MARGARKYPIPKFLEEAGIDQESFGRWLDRVSVAHIVRDRKRLVGQKIVPAVYRKAIYEAVIENDGVDHYTGEPLDWKLLQYFAGEKVVDRDEKYVPSVDHENLSATEPIFRICSLRTNKCMSNFTTEEVLEFARALINHQTKQA